MLSYTIDISRKRLKNNQKCSNEEFFQRTNPRKLSTLYLFDINLTQYNINNELYIQIIAACSGKHHITNIMKQFIEKKI